MRLVAALLTFVISLQLSAQPIDLKAVDRLVTSTMRAWQLPGISVAIVRNDRVILVKGYGTKEAGGTEPVTADTLFQLASTSKAFTSTALAMLATEKKLSWDDPVRKHLDYFHLADLCADSQVTIRDIVSHRTGLKRHDELWDNTPLTREDVIRGIGQVKLTKPFRSAYQYQNIMFIAAGEVVANTSGMSWDDFASKRIFEPLGMKGTVLSDEAWRAADHATGYRYDWKSGRITPQEPIDTATIGAGGGIKSNANDMARWVRFQLAGGAIDLKQLVDPEMLQETKTPQTVIRVENSSRDLNPESNVMAYGMGWVIQDYRSELLVSHAGALNGFRAHVDLLPKRNTGFALLTNLGRGYALIALRNSLTDLLAGKPGRDWNAYYLMVERKADEKEEREKQELESRKIAGTTPSRSLEDYAGDYESAGYGKAKVSVAASGLVLQWNQLTIPLKHFHYDVFKAESEPDAVDEQVVFALGPAKAVEGMTLFGEEFTRR